MSLEEIRSVIDKLDEQIISLLQQRFEVAASAQSYKNAIRDKHREEDILSKIDGSDVKEVYQEIFRISRKKQSIERNNNG
ncbi:MAG: chorismate mutase [Chlamydiota bacterium]